MIIKIGTHCGTPHAVKCKGLGLGLGPSVSHLSPSTHSFVTNS